ncbi:MAG: hypothetical protein Q9227_008827 [Pyrenula ochraceoflavens]
MGPTVDKHAMGKAKSLDSEKIGVIKVESAPSTEPNGPNNSNAVQEDTHRMTALQRKVTDLTEKLSEMEQLLMKRNARNLSLEDLVDAELMLRKMKEKDNSTTKEAKQAAFGSLASVKLIPYDGARNSTCVALDPSVRAHCIVAFYDSLPSHKPGLEIVQSEVLEADLLPVRIAINSRHIVAKLESISGTSMGDEPCM